MSSFHFWHIKCTVLGCDVNNIKRENDNSVTPTLPPQSKIVFFVHFIPQENWFQEKYALKINILWMIQVESLKGMFQIICNVSLIHKFRLAETPECWIIEFQLDSIFSYNFADIKLSENINDLSTKRTKIVCKCHI